MSGRSSQALEAADLLGDLPVHLAERVRPCSQGPCGGEFVLVWMSAAARGHEHPGLDVALAAADLLELPVFVYQALSERYPYASDRHHTFILEGARDAHRELAERGLGAGFHLERPGHRGPVLRALARRAALVVADDIPAPPLRGWLERLAGAIAAPVWAVDSACVLPMNLVRRCPERAFEFRRETGAERLRRAARGWPERPVARPGFVPADLPFEPVDLDGACLAELVAACEIDHTVGPVPHTRGGSQAGYARWAAFLEGGGLARYAAARNRADLDGTSRMSPWIHHGHVSPFRLAREAAARGGPGAEKWLDELLTWRELAWAWCRFQGGDLHDLRRLPGWARATLEAHREDPRPELPSSERLARGRTGEPLWDACQRSLLRHGEIHNNVRMTWGKQLPLWTSSPEAALRALVDLNHRYALDGRDPASYGGLYWCLGLFDRPFPPARPVTGTLRRRDAADRPGPLRLEAFQARTSRPLVAAPPRVAVIGAGMAGLACARVLSDHGLEVEVFDKARGPSGRMSTRRVGGEGAGVQFDHGAQHFTVGDPVFGRWVEGWREEGLVAPWEGRFGRLDEQGRFHPQAPARTRWVGVPGMSALGRHLASDLTLRAGVRVVAVRPDPSGWILEAEGGETLGPFQRVVVAVPAPQAVPLLAALPSLAERAAALEMVPSLTWMLAFQERLEAPFDGVRIEGSPLAWLARDSSKPGRPAGEAWVAQVSPAWAAARLEDPPEEVMGALLPALQRALGTDQAPASSWLHRWRYARPLLASASGRGWAYDPGAGVGVCGDAWAGPRLEAAWRSGVGLAGRLLGGLALDPGPGLGSGRP